jgi:MFS family permease
MAYIDTEGARPAESPWRRAANFTVILLGPGAGGLAFGVIAPVLKPMATQLGSEHISQIIIVMPMLGLALGSLAGAWIAEHLGARRTTGLSGLTLMLAGIVPSFAPIAPVLLVDCFLIGVAAALMFIGTTLLLADRYSDDRRARVIGFSNAFGNITSALAVMVTGVTADRFGWQGAFLQFTVAGSIIGIVTLAAVRDRRAKAREAVQPLAFSLLVPLFPVFAANFLVFSLALAIYTQMPLLLAAEGISSITTTSTVIGMQSVFGIAAGLVYGALQARHGKGVVAMIGLGLLTAGSALAAISHEPIGYGAASASVGAGIGFVIPYLTNVLLNKAQPNLRARALGLCTAIGFIGGFASPFLFRPIRDLMGLHGLFAVLTATLLIIGGAAFIRGSAARWRRRPA